MTSTIQSLDESLSIRDGRLYMEECDLTELAERYGTPLHLVSEDHLRRRFRTLLTAFQEAWPEGRVELLPSVKANFTAAAWRVLAEEGAGADVFGPHEFRFALRNGIPPERLSLNGPKGLPAIHDAIEVGARITLDAISELELVQAAARELGRPGLIRFRARPDLPLDDPSDYASEDVSVRELNRIYKAGIPLDDLLSLDLAALPRKEVQVTGVHFHVGRHLPGLEFWDAVVRSCVEVIARLHEEWNGWEPGEIDLGGGLPSPRDPFGKAIPRVQNRAESAPTVAEFAQAITETLREELTGRGISPQGRVLQLEPGRATFGNAGVHLARVLGVKHQRSPGPLTWVQTDTSETFLPDSTLDHYRWEFLIAGRPQASTGMTADLVGMACSMDRVVGDALVPSDIAPGEVIAFLETGAYQDAVSCNRNLLGRPATVIISGSRHRIVKRAETLDDVLSRDVPSGS